jgi:hypothetical protein
MKDWKLARAQLGESVYIVNAALVLVVPRNRRC